MQYTEEQIQEIRRKSFGKLYERATLSTLQGFSDGLFKRTRNWISTPRGSLVLVGPPGCGKTYFASAILELVLPKFRFFRIYKETDLFKKLRSAFSDKSTGDYVSHLELLLDDDLSVIDDVGASGYTEWREEILFETIEHRIHLDKPTIYTTNLSFQEFKERYSPRIASRLFAVRNTILDFTGYPDLRQKYTD